MLGKFLLHILFVNQILLNLHNVLHLHLSKIFVQLDFDTFQVHKLVCQGTLEEKINTLLIEKRELASQSVGTGDNWFTNMDTDELKEMFSLNMSKAVQG